MTNSTYTAGADALSALTATNDGGSKSKSFTKLRSGTSFKVRVLTPSDLIAYYGYSIYNVIDTFAAEKPSSLNAKGYPEKNLTLWDKAAKYYQDLAFKELDEAKKEELKKSASLYRGSTRFVIGFIDLDTGAPIYVDFSKKQALAVHGVIKKNEKKLDKKPFELEKTGADTSTIVTLTPLDLDDLTEKQQAKFAEWDEKDKEGVFNYDGLLYESDEAKQADDLRKAGFDLTLIGYGGDASAEQIPVDVAETDFPF